MNTLSSRDFRQFNWSTLVMFALGFWLSSSLILDGVIVPSLFKSGMMSQVGFVNLGYAIFESFNHLELLCGSFVLAGCLALGYQNYFHRRQTKWIVALSSVLLLIAIAYTYVLTPQMSGMGLGMNLFEPVGKMPESMMMMHGIYWLLEAVKLLGATTLLSWYYRNSGNLA